MSNRFVLAVLGLSLSACTLGVPQVTPTVAPTNTPTIEGTSVLDVPSATPVIRLTDTPTQTLPPTFTGTPVPIPTQTETLTPTLTFTPSVTFTGTPPPTATNTPTVTPSDTPSVTPTSTSTPTPTITPSLTATFTGTPPPTATDTASPTSTDTPTATTTPTATHTATNTVIPTNTFTPTATVTGTASPTLTPTDTPTMTATASRTPTPIPTDTPVPTPTRIITVTPLPTDTMTNTPLPTITPTSTATFTPIPPTATSTLSADQIRALTPPTIPPSWTPVPLSSPTSTLVPPTLDVTPTIITATPGSPTPIQIIDTPIPSTPEIQPQAPTQTPVPTIQPTIFVEPTLIQQGFVTPIPPPVIVGFTSSSTNAYNFNVGPGGFSVGGSSVPGGVVLFAQNPAFPNSYARTDQVGMLYFAPPGSPEGTFTFAPYFAGFSVPSAAENKNRIAEIEWSPNGQNLAFLIDPPRETDNVNAGVWFWQPDASSPTDPSLAILRDCPYGGHLACNIVAGRPAVHWRSLAMEWSPNSASLLVSLELPEEGRRALAVVDAVRDPNYANNAPAIRRYESGSWVNDNRILVSGRRESDGRVVIAYVDRALNNEQILYDATANNMWVQDAVQRSTGEILTLGNPGAPGTSVRLYSLANGQLAQISGPIGDSFPQRIEWFGDRSGVVVTAGGRQFTVLANGTITDSSGKVSGTVNVGQGGVSGIPYPDGVLEGSPYFPGQQLTIIANSLNLRAEPSTATAILGGVFNGEYVAILAGPYSSEGYGWWKVLNARGRIGWIAAEQGNSNFLAP